MGGQTPPQRTIAELWLDLHSGSRGPEGAGGRGGASASIPSCMSLCRRAYHVMMSSDTHVTNHLMMLCGVM